MENETSHIIEPPNWTDELVLEDFFDTSQPLEVDVGCGKGRFLIARAEKNQNINYLGIDRLLVRLRLIDKRLQRRNLTNGKVLRIENHYAVQYLLPKESVSAFYVFFPDPWPKKRHHKRRMFNEEFLKSLHTRLKDGGTVNVATDHPQYFEEIQELFANSSQYKEIETFEPSDDERTGFEIIFLEQNLKIGRASYQKI